MRLIFVRHGEPDYEHDCLTENGRIQAESTAKRLHNEPIVKIYASTNGRATETASYVAKDHGLDIIPLDFMREIDWGRTDDKKAEGELKYNGHPWSLACDLLAENPELVGSPDWDKHPYFSENKCTGFTSVIGEKIDNILEEYGLERKGGIYTCRRACDDTIALFAHGGSGACMISHILSLPFPFVLSSMPYGVCSVSIFTFAAPEGDPVIPRIELFNDCNHIARMKAEKLVFER